MTTMTEPQAERGIAGPMTEAQYIELRQQVTHLLRLERVAIAMENMVDAFARDGFPEEQFTVEVSTDDGEASVGPKAVAGQVRKVKDSIYRKLYKAVQGSALHELVENTHGLNAACYLLAGMVPPLSEMDGPASLWRYIGAHVVDGSAPKRRKGQRASWKSEAMAVAIARIGDPIIKMTAGTVTVTKGKAAGTTYEREASPYRLLYDDRKAATLDTHPPMFTYDDDGNQTKTLAHPDCEDCQTAVGLTEQERAERDYTRERKTVGRDCANVGGIHWTDGHRHADARRVMVKEVLKDLWRVENGYEPRVGQRICDTQFRIADSGAE